MGKCLIIAYRTEIRTLQVPGKMHNQAISSSDASKVGFFAKDDPALPETRLPYTRLSFLP